jgi:hypothetical protein
MAAGSPGKRRAAGDHHRPPRRGHGIEVIHLERDDLVLAGHIADRRAGGRSG